MKRLVDDTNIDLYAYSTFTSPNGEEIERRMRVFVDKLQAINENLPLRLVPLEVQTFTPVVQRLKRDAKELMDNQNAAVYCWKNEISKRFTSELRNREIYDIPLRS